MATSEMKFNNDSERAQVRAKFAKDINDRMSNFASKYRWKILAGILLFPFIILALIVWTLLTFQLIASFVEFAAVLVLYVKHVGIDNFFSEIFQHFGYSSWGINDFVERTEFLLLALATTRLLIVFSQAVFVRFYGGPRKFFAVIISLLVTFVVSLRFSLVRELLCVNFDMCGLNAETESKSFLIPIVAFIASWITTFGEFWVPTSYQSLTKAEERLYELYGLDVKVRVDKESGLSYIHVPQEETSLPPAERRVLLMTHGFGAGKVLYVPSIKILRKHFEIYAVDWSGLGASTRSFKWVFANPDSAAEYYIEGLEKWRKNIGIDKVHLLGHSLGGFLSGLYAIKYPEHVAQIIFVSPVGLPPRPDNLPNIRVISALWEARFSPNLILRLAGPFARVLVGFFAKRRFEDFMEHIEAVADYLFHVNSSPVAGELGMTSVLGPGAFARKPLAPQLVQRLQCKSTFMYGESDWMDIDAGVGVVKELTSSRSMDSQLFLIKGAGHQIFIQNLPAFCNAVLVGTGVMPLSSINDVEDVLEVSEKFTVRKI